MGGAHNAVAVISVRNEKVTELKKLINTTTVVSSSPEVIINFNEEEAREKYLKYVPLYNATLNGDWPAAKRIIAQDQTHLTARISIGGLTVLHLAAGTNFVHFVEQLVAMMTPEHLELRDEKGNTALCFAAIGGTIQIARILLAKNPSIATMRGGGGMTPLYMAALFGKPDMAWYLYDKTEESLTDGDQRGIFFSCIDSAIYDLALKMVNKNIKLATTRDRNGMTALHLFAQTPQAFTNESSEGWFKSCLKLKLFKRNFKRNNQALELVKCVWNHLVSLGHDEAMNVIRTPELLFDASRMGNFVFLHELIKSYPHLAWEHDIENRSIIHFAVMYREFEIFNMIHDIGPIRKVIATYEDSERNNLLHLAARLPPFERLNSVSGPALQMQQELAWFQMVKKIVQPIYVKKQNKRQETPHQLFSLEHKTLQEDAERWMKNTSQFGMIVSILIATVAFATAFTMPRGNNNNQIPNYHKSISFMIFMLLDKLSFTSSVISTIMFFSILTSRYAESDFQKSLPLKLMAGLASQFFSLMTMVIAFGTTVFIARDAELTWVTFYILVFTFIPTVLFLLLQFPILYDTFISTCLSRTLFKPTQRKWY